MLALFSCPNVYNYADSKGSPSRGKGVLFSLLIEDDRGEAMVQLKFDLKRIESSASDRLEGRNFRLITSEKS